MPKNIHLTLACGDYEILRGLIDGATAPEGVDLTILKNMDSTTRHWRFLRNGEFDIVRAVRLVLPDDARPGHGDRRDPGVSASPLPPRLHLHQHVEGHQERRRT